MLFCVFSVTRVSCACFCLIQTGSTALHLAAHQGHTDTVEVLLGLGGDPCIANNVR